MSTHIAFDATAVRPGRKGLGRLCEQVVDAWAVMPDAFGHVRCTVFHSEEWTPPSAPYLDPVPIQPALNTVVQYWQLPRELSRRAVDLHITGNDFTALVDGCQLMMYLFETPRRRVAVARPDGLKSQLAALVHPPMFRRTVARCAHVATSSESTRAELIRDYAIDHTRTSVIPPGVPELYRSERVPPRLAGIGAEAPYVLHVCTGDARENTVVALMAFGQFIQRTDAPHRLVLAGGGAESAAIQAALQREGLADRTDRLGFLGEAEMYSAYRNAWCYFDPSLFEGFGLQICEAQACGTPVVCSNNTAIPEAAGAGALLFPADDTDALAGGLAALLDPEVHRHQSERGRQHTEQFVWSRTAADLLARARQLCEGGAVHA